jgi:hypothetical protein
MADAERSRHIRAVDDFLMEAKTLDGRPPLWRPTPNRPHELSATWGIKDAIDVQRAELRFRCVSVRRQFPSVSVIFQRTPIWRIDLVPVDETKNNPHWAQSLGLPALVIGSHSHAWPDNKDHIVRAKVDWELPCRRPLPPPMRRLPQVLPWLADQINLSLTPEQRGFDVPPQSDLFAPEGGNA